MISVTLHVWLPITLMSSSPRSRTVGSYFLHLVSAFQSQFIRCGYPLTKSLSNNHNAIRSTSCAFHSVRFFYQAVFSLAQT